MAAIFLTTILLVTKSKGTVFAVVTNPQRIMLLSWKKSFKVKIAAPYVKHKSNTAKMTIKPLVYFPFACKNFVVRKAMVR